MDGSWPHEHSSLRPNPDAVFGRLENGFRYVLLRHGAPKGRAALYLDMQVGSLMETDAQAGIAHYMEHMVFNGSRHFPPGELIKYFQSVGMRFGSDANAHTSTQETVYKLQVPTSDADVLHQGLVVLSDFLGGASISEQEVSNERGVILEEKIARDTERFRASLRRLNFLLPGTRFVNPTIGVESVIKGANAKLLRGFYDSWYRPELAVLVVVGDFDVQALEAEVKAVFSSAKARGVRPEVPAWGDASLKGVHFYYDRRPDASGMVSVEALHPRKYEHDSLAVQRTLIKGQLAVRMLQARLMTLVDREGSPCIKAMSRIGRTFSLFDNARIIAIPREGQWKQAVHLVENELRRALDHGFTSVELQRAKKFYGNYFKQSLKKETARDSADIAQEIVACLNQDRVYQSPSQTYELFLPMLSELTLNEVNATFRDAWDSGNRMVGLSGVELDAKVEPEAELSAVWTAASKDPVVAWKAEDEVSFPYLKVPSYSGQSVERFEEISLTKPYCYQRTEFSNGFSLFMKNTSVEKDKVFLNLSFGRGTALMSDKEQALARFVLKVLRNSGVGRLTSLQQSQVLAGRSIDFSWKAQSMGLGLYVSCLRSDLDMAFHLLRTALLNPVVRQNQYDAALTQVKNDNSQQANTSSGVLSMKGKRFLAEGAGHFADLDYAEVETFSLKDVRNYISSAFRQGPLFLCAVGDFEPDVMENLAGRFFGTLPEWKAADGDPVKLHFPVGQSETAHIKHESSQAGVLLAVPVPYIDSGENVSGGHAVYVEQVKLRLLRRVLADRLRVNLRERLGVSYSPRAILKNSVLYKGYGYLGVQVETEVGNTEVVEKEIRKIMKDLTDSGVTAEELNRVVRQSLALQKKVVNRLGYWNSLLYTTARVHPDGFERAASAARIIESVSAQDMTVLARKYLMLDNAALFTVLPSDL
ncbi:peptidase M16 [Pseudodesulfovibrio sediminis]|uniref:Peptidase M16 n=1 Tax=Pseudodesulfovibrio sediminis TaxID=2810563 RepID=A0ABN6ESV8_9BACT|nr:peptidase M16 [Pseudodesulfovibrio sediminis]